jgi:integrase
LVFASLKPDNRGRLGGPYGKRFARHLKRRAKIIGVTFHDTRHAWQTAARNAEVPQEIRRAIMGHRQEDGVAEDCGEKQGPVVLAKHLNRVYPFADVS